MADIANNRCGYVAITGRPNVGKSTLLNRIIGQKLAITSHKPQTTRHTILGVKTDARGQVIYVDTPGIHQRGEQVMNRYLNRAAKSVLADVDLAMFVVEALRWTDEDAAVLTALQAQTIPIVLVINKVDRIKPIEALLPFLDEVGRKHDFLAIVPLSAKTGKGIVQLEEEILCSLPKSDNIFPPDQLSDRSERFFAAELIREQLIQRYSKEIPYALAVEIEKFEESEKMYRISALIWVERPGQKAILIGTGGTALKEAARQARIEMEKLFDRKVHLNVWVKVKQSWSNDERALSLLGYGD